MSGNPPHLFEEQSLRIVTAIRDLFEGRSNAVGSVTLRASQTTTDVDAINCGEDSKVFLMPTTAAASTAFASAYISTVAAGSFTITHASDAASDQTFFWVCLG